MTAEALAPSFTSISQLDALPMPGGVSWIPVRAALGYGAHGVNAWRADEVGADVIEQHTEAEATKHQELYVVLEGRARFTVDGVEEEAGPGGVVFVPDWKSTRGAVALEAPTVILTMGGSAGFVPSPWEYSQRALLIADSDPDGARAIFEEGFDVLPENGAMHYNYACLLVKLGDLDEAFPYVQQAIYLRPDLREHLATDPDIAGLREHPRFGDL